MHAFTVVTGSENETDRQFIPTLCNPILSNPNFSNKRFIYPISSKLNDSFRQCWSAITAALE